MNIFVTGTENNVGKTFITTALAALMQSLGYKSGIYKPFQCGAERKNGFSYSRDLAFVKKIDSYIATSCSYMLKTPVVPALASEIEKVVIDPNIIVKDYTNLQEKCDLVLAEGEGGIGVPVNSKLYMTDIIRLLKLPILIITTPDKNVVNKTLLTVNQAEQVGIKIRGVIIKRLSAGN